MFLKEAKARNSYNNGVILENRQNMKYVIIFSLCNMHFSSTEKRAKKGKQYRLDNPYWKVYTGGLLKKLELIRTGRVKMIKRKVL